MSALQRNYFVSITFYSTNYSLIYVFPDRVMKTYLRPDYNHNFILFCSYLFTELSGSRCTQCIHHTDFIFNIFVIFIQGLLLKIFPFILVMPDKLPKVPSCFLQYSSVINQYFVGSRAYPYKITVKQH